MHGHFWKRYHQHLHETFESSDVLLGAQHTINGKTHSDLLTRSLRYLVVDALVVLVRREAILPTLASDSLAPWTHSLDCALQRLVHTDHTLAFGLYELGVRRV